MARVRRCRGWCGVTATSGPDVVDATSRIRIAAEAHIHERDGVGRGSSEVSVSVVVHEGRKRKLIR